MTAQSLTEAMSQACAAVGIDPPKKRLVPDVWVRTDTLGKNGKGDGSVKLDVDLKGGTAMNYQTGLHQRFRLGMASNDNRPADPKVAEKRRERERQIEAERREVERICAAIVAGCREDRHAYFDKKGFPEELGLVCDDPREFFPSSRFGEALGRALPEGGGPFLIIPGRIGGKLVTVQFITVTGEKKNILKGVMSGAFHRIATGRDTWVCEGIGTALTARAALKVLGANATVLSAFSASNVGKVAEAIAGSRIAADHDKPVETLENRGAGEFYARRSGRKFVMPPEPGDWNDHHMKHGLRSVAVLLREALG